MKPKIEQIRCCNVRRFQGVYYCLTRDEDCRKNIQQKPIQLYKTNRPYNRYEIIMACKGIK